MFDTPLAQRVVRIIAETLEIPFEELTPATRIKEDLGADSMQVVTIMIALDEAFDAEFDIAEIPPANVTVDWVCGFVQRTIGPVHEAL
jgi:acyl carrier protein